MKKYWEIIIILALSAALLVLGCDKPEDGSAVTEGLMTYCEPCEQEPEPCQSECEPCEPCEPCEQECEPCECDDKDDCWDDKDDDSDDDCDDECKDDCDDDCNDDCDDDCGDNDGGVGEDDRCNQMETMLVAGQHMDAGKVVISHDEMYLYVKLMCDNGWSVHGSHVAVAESMEELPQTKSGNPPPGQFPYKHGCLTDDCTQIYQIPLESLGWTTNGECSDREIVVAVHAEVSKSCNGQTQSETAWGKGPGFPGKNWAMYIEYDLDCCEPVDAGGPDGDVDVDADADADSDSDADADSDSDTDPIIE
jgi:hypothetical protein